MRTKAMKMNAGKTTSGPPSRGACAVSVGGGVGVGRRTMQSPGKVEDGGHGCVVGEADGGQLGSGYGDSLGTGDGTSDGSVEGATLGGTLGVTLGATLGAGDGEPLGCVDGSPPRQWSSLTPPSKGPCSSQS